MLLNVRRVMCCGPSGRLSNGSTDSNKWKVYRHIGDVIRTATVFPGLTMFVLGLYEGHLESKERFAIQRYLLIIGKKQNMQVL